VPNLVEETINKKEWVENYIHFILVQN